MIARRSFVVSLAAFAAAAVTACRDARAKRRIGYLMARDTASPLDQAFVDGLRELGYEVDRDIVLERRWGGADAERMRRMAEELAASNVEVMVVATTGATRAAMRATRTIPIVMIAAADPVGSKLVDDLARPGGNVTGLSLLTTDMARKRLQQMRDIVPGLSAIGLLAQRLADPSLGTTDRFVRESQSAATALGLALVVEQVAKAEEIDDAFASFKARAAQAIVVQAGPLTIEHRRRIIELAERARLPAMYELREFVDDGGFVSYGPVLADNYRRAASYVDRILKGAKPADLPVQQPERFALVINRQAAATMSLDIPQSVLLGAELVEVRREAR